MSGGSFARFPVSDDRKTISCEKCGAKLPNTFDGMMQAREHECEPATQ